MRSTTIKSTLATYNYRHIDNDLVMFSELASLQLPTEPVRMGCILVGMCLKGKATYTVDTVEYAVEPGDVLVIGEGQVTEGCTMSDDCSGIGLMISNRFFEESIKGAHEMSSVFLFARTHPVCHLQQAEAKAILGYFRIMEKKVDQHDHRFRKETVQALFNTMVYDLGNAIYRLLNDVDLRHTRSEKIFTDFIRLVEQNFRQQRRVQWYGRRLCISPKYLLESVKTASRRTPNEWIDHYVTMELRVQLRNSSKSIKEIAQEMHFSNQSFMGKYFKEHIGMSPSQYRKKGS